MQQHDTWSNVTMVVSSGVFLSSQATAVSTVPRVPLSSDSTCSLATHLWRAHSLATSSLTCGEKPPLRRAASLAASNPLRRSHSLAVSSFSAANRTHVGEQPSCCQAVSLTVATGVAKPMSNAATNPKKKKGVVTYDWKLRSKTTRELDL